MAPAVVLGGVSTVLVTALWAWLFPALRKLDRLSGLTLRCEEPGRETAD